MGFNSNYCQWKRHLNANPFNRKQFQERLAMVNPDYYMFIMMYSLAGVLKSDISSDIRINKGKEVATN